MNGRHQGAARTLRDYPISLRQSARAVFGSVYERDEKVALESLQDDKARAKLGC